MLPKSEVCRDWFCSELWKQWSLALTLAPPEVLLCNRMGSGPSKRAKAEFNMAQDYQVVF